MTMMINDEGLELLENTMKVAENPRAQKSLDELKRGNEIFVQNRGHYYSDMERPAPAPIVEFHRSLEPTLQEITHHQTPAKAILACSDSRVSPDAIFSHQGFNLMFEVRNAGNILTPEVEESMVVPASHDTPLLVVCGHYSCGAMNACANARKSAEANQTMAATVANINATAPNSVKDADEIALYNVANVVYRLANSRNPALKNVFTGGKMKIAPAMYSIDTGKVTFLDFALISGLLKENSK